jgi:hypothetical protein
MSLLKTLLSKIGRVPPPMTSEEKARAGAKPDAPKAAASFFGPAKAPPGPLKLATGDFVSHYKDRFAVVGLRVVEGDGSTVYHYRLRDAEGAEATLVAEDCPDPVFSLQRPVAGAIQWDAEVLNDVADEPMRIVQRGKMKVKGGWDDSGVPQGARGMEYREFEDASGDRVLVLEDWQGKREMRVGSPVFEAELEFERAAGTSSGGVRSAAIAGAKAFEETPEDSISKGSPRAAAKSLEQNVGASKGKTKVVEVDRDPTAYDDDSWADAPDVESADDPAAANDPQRLPETRRPMRPLEEDEDEWISATQLVRKVGAKQQSDDSQTGTVGDED